jgi:hypothetical protein
MTVELPISTTIMLRSIVDIARSEGHDVDSAEVKLNCLEVFAFGGRSHSDDAAESGYWAIRAALAKSISEAAGFLTQRSALEKGAPAVMRLVSAIASRFGVVVSEQLAAKAGRHTDQCAFYEPFSGNGARALYREAVGKGLRTRSSEIRLR